MDKPRNIINPNPLNDDRDFENALRPRGFADFVGQTKVIENLKIYIEAARQRGEALDHVLLYGPPGLGKTTLAYIISNELEVDIKTTSGPVMDKAGAFWVWRLRKRALWKLPAAPAERPALPIGYCGAPGIMPR